MRLTASQRKLITSLSSARQRRLEGLFVVEGIRSLRELLPAFTLRYLVATATWLDENADELKALVGNLPDDVLLVAKNDELARMSSMSTPQGVMAVFSMPSAADQALDVESGELVLALDRVQDPGNLGAIIRVADWFGIHKIFASMETVDVYNPKVIQSTMGAIARVKVVYCDLEQCLEALGNKNVPIYGTFLDGRNLYDSDIESWGVIVMGNEGNGISPEVGAKINRRILIPSYPPGVDTVESLNVGTATAITVAEFRRRTI
jgi:TrmH family RNA methyltransferase